MGRAVTQRWWDRVTAVSHPHLVAQEATANDRRRRPRDGVFSGRVVERGAAFRELNAAVEELSDAVLAPLRSDHEIERLGLVRVQRRREARHFSFIRGPAEISL